MMSAIAWVVTTGVILIAVLVLGLLYARYRFIRYALRCKLETELKRDELKRVEARLLSERHFRLDFTNNILVYDTVTDKIRYTRDFEEWAALNLRHPLDIEDFTGMPFLFLADDNEAFAFKIRWG